MLNPTGGRKAPISNNKAMTRTLQYQQAQSKRWMFTHSPELKDFWPQETFRDLTNLMFSIDPIWEECPWKKRKRPPERCEAVIDEVFGSEYSWKDEASAHRRRKQKRKQL
jgi:hypothetical protein